MLGTIRTTSRSRLQRPMATRRMIELDQREAITQLLFDIVRSCGDVVRELLYKMVLLAAVGISVGGWLWVLGLGARWLVVKFY